jgi:ATP synthase protein I
VSDDQEKDEGRQWRNTLLLSSAGLRLAISVAIGFLIGYYLDQYFKTTWLVMVFGLLGIVAGFKELIQAVNRANAAEDEARARRRGRRGGTGDDGGEGG